MNKHTARKLITQSLMVVAIGVVLVGVPSYFALDYGSDLGESKALVVTLENAAESHDDAIAAARNESALAKEESALAKEARDASASWVIDLQADVKKGDVEIAALRLKLEESKAAPRGSCSAVQVRLNACNEIRLEWAQLCRGGLGWHPRERP